MIILVWKRRWAFFLQRKYLEGHESEVITLEKPVGLRIEESIIKAAKMQALKEDKTLKQYIIDLIMADIEKKKGE